MSSHVAVCKAMILCDTNNHYCTQESLTAGRIHFWEGSTLLSQVLQLHAQQPVPCDVLLNCPEIISDLLARRMQPLHGQVEPHLGPKLLLPLQMGLLLGQAWLLWIRAHFVFEAVMCKGVLSACHLRGREEFRQFLISLWALVHRNGLAVLDKSKLEWLSGWMAALRRKEL